VNDHFVASGIAEQNQRLLRNLDSTWAERAYFASFIAFTSRAAFEALRRDLEEQTASGSVTVLGRALSPAFAATSPPKWPTHGASEDSTARPKHSSL
jgi:hypothetical protein